MRKVWLWLAVLLVGFAGGALGAYTVSYVHYGGSAYFTDCDPASVHDQNIGYLAEYGVTTGYPDGTFRPWDPVNRGQMATFLMRQTVRDSVYTTLVMDFDYFGGYYFGDQAYLDGAITYEQYLANVDAYNWFYDLVSYQMSVSASSRGELRPPISGPAPFLHGKKAPLPRK